MLAPLFEKGGRGGISLYLDPSEKTNSPFFPLFQRGKVRFTLNFTKLSEN